MKLSKKKLVSILFLGLIIFFLFVNLFSIKGLGSISDISFDLENDILYNSENINFSNSFNIRNPEIYTEIYNATYSFFNESGLESTNISLIYDDSSVNPSKIDVIENLDGHNEVLRITDGSGATRARFWSNGSAIGFGTIELWIRTTDSTKTTDLRLIDDSIINGPALQIDSSQLRYYDSGWQNIQAISNNLWYHLRIDFECTGGGYLGLPLRDFYITVNGVQYGNYNFYQTPSDINGIYMYTNTGHSDYTSYIDGVGFSWYVNYSIRDNLFPFTEVNTNSYEVDRFEFANNNINSLYPIGSDNPDGWTDIEVGGGDQVNVVAGFQANDKVVYASTFAATNERGLEKTFNKDGKFINITFADYYVLIGGATNGHFHEIQSKDGTIITILTIVGDGTLDYWDGGWHTLRADIVIETNYEFNLFLNYELNRVFLIYSVEGLVVAHYDYPMTSTTKQGIKEVLTYILTNSAHDFDVLIDYVGVYIEGISQASSYAWIEIDLVKNNWSFENNNLFTIQGSGDFHIGSIAGAYQVGETMRVVNNMDNYNNISQFYNIYDNYIADITYPSLILTLLNDNFTVSKINIEGVKLIEGINEYWLEYTHGNIDIDENYFYVDNNNRLQFTHIANDTNLEYIQAEFNINDISSSNYAIKFHSNIDYNAYGYFRVNFTDISNFIPIPIYDTTTRIFISQNKTISSLIVLITDDDIDTIQGSTNGYVSEIELLYVVGIGVSITTSNLLTIIIPLIIIFIPTFLLSAKVGKNMIVPLMILMSIICVLTEIIPLWLFFVIIFPASLFLFLKRKEGLF